MLGGKAPLSDSCRLSVSLWSLYPFEGVRDYAYVHEHSLAYLYALLSHLLGSGSVRINKERRRHHDAKI